MINTKKYVQQKSHLKSRRGRKGGATSKYTLFQKFIERQQNEQRLLDQLREYVRENRNCIRPENMSKIKEENCSKNNSIDTKEYLTKTLFGNHDSYYLSFSIFNKNYFPQDASKYSIVLNQFHESNKIPQKLENIFTAKPPPNCSNLNDNCRILFTLQPKIHIQKLNITNQPNEKINQNPKLREMRIIIERIPTNYVFI